MKKELKPNTILAPLPVVMVSCGNMENANILSIAWTGIINSDPPMVSISIRPSRYSYEIINQTKEFVLNIPDETLVWQVDYCGTKSGKQVKDKFKEAKLTKEESKKIKAPAIKECPISLECKVNQIKSLGSHDIFMAEIVAVNAKEDLLDENGNINISKVNAIAYIGQDYYVANKKIADRGICLKSNIS